MTSFARQRFALRLLLCVFGLASASTVMGSEFDGPGKSGVSKGVVDVMDATAPKLTPLDLTRTSTSAGGVTVVDTAFSRVEAARLITPQPENVFGETVDPMTQNFRFNQTDLLLRGTGPDIAIRRSFDVNGSRSGWWQREHAFGDWRLELPRMSTLTPHHSFQAPWSVAGANPSKRCTAFGQAPNVSISGYSYPASEWWQGVQVNIPGEGIQEVLKRSSENTLSPTMTLNNTSLTFPLVTAGNWMISCLPATSNGMAGEAFLAVSPTGDKYWFDRLVTGTWEWYSPAFMPGFGLYRLDAMMLPSRIEDRYGNSLTFTYDGPRVTEISASDGRKVGITWQSVNGISFISSITEQPLDAKARSWVYAYSTPPNGRSLNKVTLPDASQWTFNFDQLTQYCAGRTEEPGGPVCSDNPGDWSLATGTAVSPSGITATFKVGAGFGTRLLTNPLPPSTCLHEVDPFGLEIINVKAYSREYKGPGVDQKWIYQCSEGGCPASFANMNLDAGSTLGVEKLPSGKYLIQAVDVTWCGPRYGEVTKTFIDPTFDANGFVSAARIVDPTKAAPNTGPFPSRIGTVPQTYANREQLEYLRPLQQRDIIQDGVTFTWKAETFDAYGKPAKVKRSSTPGGASRTETTVYNNDVSRWHLSRIASVTEQASGAVSFAQTFDAVTGNVATQSVFGKVEQTLTHYASGLVQTVKDAGNHQTLFSEYKRGIPQRIDHADGTVVTAVIDNLGDVTSTTDALGFTTAYEYDALSRMKKVTYPGIDVTAWSPEAFTFTRVATVEYGLTAGHWKHTTEHGNYRRSVYYDARWNPVLTREYDATDATGTDRFTARHFDHAGRETFLSYPVDNATLWTGPTAGFRTTYDGLGRVTRREQDSELGVLATTTAFLSPFKTETRNPRNFATTTTYQVFDEPTYDFPLVVTAPESVTSVFVRDNFGKPKSLQRSGIWGGSNISSLRSFVYDTHHRLCKLVEPDAGVTILGYDVTGNVDWHASGQTFTSTSACNQADVAAGAKSIRSYDAMNRLLGINHPSGTEDVGYTYFADGALKTATSGGSTWTYVYNKRRLLESESLAVAGKTFLLDWAYNGQGIVSNLVYPSGLSVGFNPTVFGKPRQVGTYATAATYLPNGGLDGFTYGNGAVRDVTPNTRLLPDRIRDTKGAVVLLDHTLDFDENGNVSGILDGVPGGLESKTLTYDGRDRLTGVTGSSTGNEVYTYDPLDNVRQATQGSHDRRFHYHSTTRRLERIASPSGVEELSYTWNARGEVATRTWPVTEAPPSPGDVFGDGFEIPGNTYTESFNFDAAKRLTSYAGGGATYAYDAHGRRISTTIPLWGTRYQIYSRSGQLLYVEDSALSQRVDYLHLGDSLVARRVRPTSAATATTTYLHTDHRRSTSVESNASGAMVLRSRSESFGEPVDGVFREGPGFAGHVMDEVGNFVYMQQRYYDPLAMRFLSPDPVEAGVESFNRYWYANNNPYRFVDPDGRIPVDTVLDAAFTIYDAGQFLGAASAWGVGHMTGNRSLAAEGWAGMGETGGNVAMSAGSILVPYASAPAARVAGAAASETTTLYRAVMNSELDDIVASGTLRNPAGIETKYFATSAEDASSYAQQAFGKFGDTSPYTIIRTEAPTSILPPPIRVDRGGIPSIVVPTDDLKHLSPPEILPSMPWDL